MSSKVRRPRLTEWRHAGPSCWIARSGDRATARCGTAGGQRESDNPLIRMPPLVGRQEASWHALVELGPASVRAGC